MKEYPIVIAALLAAQALAFELSNDMTQKSSLSL